MKQITELVIKCIFIINLFKDINNNNVFYELDQKLN